MPKTRETRLSWNPLRAGGDEEMMDETTTWQQSELLKRLGESAIRFLDHSAGLIQGLLPPNRALPSGYDSRWAKEPRQGSDGSSDGRTIGSSGPLHDTARYGP